ncbi:MAG TPA: T9SS type A sorting domain-containing protein, partial [Flavobacteriales bacterium]|nr:T9SS type A sorting domain-containing protein [Flavobacteriales bacterium]
TVPVFDPPLTNPFGLTAIPYFNFPYFVDLDNDGDFDVLTGDIYGILYYYQNTGTTSAPGFAAPVTTMFSLPLYINDYSATLSMADMDNDGDKDLFTGSFSGDFHYFPNTGTASAPNFGAEIINPFGINIPGDSLSVPVLKDLDGDGDFDLLSGSYYGNFHYYENTGTVLSPNFATPQMNPFGLVEVYSGLSYPELADLDNDGDFDLMSGDYYGAWHYFENDESLGLAAAGKQSALVQLFPNPAISMVAVTTTDIAQQISLYDITGKQVFTCIPAAQKIIMNVGNYPDGLYLVKVFSSEGVETLRLVKK